MDSGPASDSVRPKAAMDHIEFFARKRSFLLAIAHNMRPAGATRHGAAPPIASPSTDLTHS